MLTYAKHKISNPWGTQSLHIEIYIEGATDFQRAFSHTYIHTYIHCVLSPVTGMSLWTCTVGFCGFFSLLMVGFFLIVILFYSILPFFVGLVTLPHVSRFIVTCIFSAALLRVSVFSLKISSLDVLGVFLFSHCCSTWSWVSSSWWHILHALSGYLFL